MLSASCGGCHRHRCRIMNVRRSQELPCNCQLICITVQFNELSNERSFFTGSLVAPKEPALINSCGVHVQGCLCMCACISLVLEMQSRAGVSTTATFLSLSLCLYVSLPLVALSLSLVASAFWQRLTLDLQQTEPHKQSSNCGVLCPAACLVSDVQPRCVRTLYLWSDGELF